MHSRRTLLKTAATATAGLGAGVLLAHSIRPTEAAATVQTNPLSISGTERADCGLIATQSDEALYLDSSGSFSLEGTVFDSDAFAREDFTAPEPGEFVSQALWVVVD